MQVVAAIFSIFLCVLEEKKNSLRLSCNYCLKEMVRVWYEPPPFGPGTDLNRSPYGIGGGGISKGLIEKMSRMNQPLVMTVGVVVACAICYIPVCK